MSNVLLSFLLFYCIFIVSSGLDAAFFVTFSMNDWETKTENFIQSSDLPNES